MLRPKERSNLVLYLKNINLPAPDKYGTSQLLAFVQQLLVYGGFHDDNLEWVGVEKVQLVASMAPSSAPLPLRLLRLLCVCSIEYPSPNELNAIYTSYLNPILDVCFLFFQLCKMPSRPKWVPAPEQRPSPPRWSSSSTGSARPSAPLSVVTTCSLPAILPDGSCLSFECLSQVIHILLVTS